MEHARATWTDERLDDLSRRIDLGFTRVDDDLRSLRGDLNTRIDILQRMMVQMMGATVLTLVTVMATLASVLLTR